MIMKSKKYELGSVELNFISKEIIVERKINETDEIITRRYNLNVRTSRQVSARVKYMHKHCQNKNKDAMWIGYPFGWIYYF